MKKRLLIILSAISVCCSAISAQDCGVSGVVVCKETGDALERATVQLLTSDSVFVAGTLTARDGSFAVRSKSPGRHILRISSLGYRELLVPLNLYSGNDVKAGTLALESVATMLDETIVTANVPKVIVREDTLVYNAAAYRVPEGSSLEALIERLPGVRIEDDGTITLNGKQITKFLMDGREFLVGDIETTLKNLPADMVENVKSYDKKSDLSKLTGIDDGNDETVLDLGIKKSMKKGVNINANIGYGTEDRYNGRFMGARFQGNTKVTVLGNANNTNNLGQGGGRGRSGGRAGLLTSKTIGANISYDKRDLLKIDGGVSWSHSDNDRTTLTSTESFVSKRGAFSNSKSQNYSRSGKWNANMSLKWTPDTMTTVNFRPTASISSGDGRSSSASASYREDPYGHSDDPLAASAIEQMAADGLMVNNRNSKSITHSRSVAVGATLQLHRKLNAKGRNVAFSGGFSYSDNDNTSLSATAVHLFLVKNAAGQDSTYQTNRYNLTPSRKTSYNLQATYTEPLFRSVFLQASYSFSRQHSVSDRSAYNLGLLDYASLDAMMNAYRDWGSVLGTLEQPLPYYLSESLSRYAEHDNYSHNIDLQLRVVNKALNMNVGLMIRPQRSRLKQDYRGVSVDTVRNVANIAPTLNLRYRFSKTSDFRLSYRGSTSQPNITQMLDITDDSNPMYISKGNPGLRPSFTNNLNMSFKAFLPKRQTTIAANVDGRVTSNSISNMTTYDDDTGAQTTQPQNINGNWYAAASLTFNTSIDTAGVWRVSSYSRASYNHNVSYITIDKGEPQKNITRRYDYTEHLSLGYRKGWLEIELVGNLDCNRTRNELQSSGNLDTWRFSYGMDIDVEAPWGMTVSTDIRQHSRRGYSDKSMNTDELVWNLQISQSLLRKKALTVSLSVYDILRQQSSFTRSITASRRTDTEYNAINSYAMLRANYRLNVFGGKAARGGGKKSRRKTAGRRR